MRYLPVDFKKAGDLLLDHIKTHKPDAVISLGLAGGRSKMTPERIAINVNDGASDNSGNVLVDQPIVEEGADGYFTTLPIREMVNALKEAELPAEISNSAGTYLCNHVMYRALHLVKTENLEIKSGFLHIPASHELAIQRGQSQVGRTKI